MSHGYSILTAREILQTKSTAIGVQLGKICVKLQIPIKDVAKYFNVSRPTVYAWFSGKSAVSETYEKEVRKLIRTLQ